VLKGSEAPAILVELGFISNSQEAKLLSKDSYQDKMAKEIAESIREYFR
jgi:N-acetylmuramoyl-L-alanine amidase